jgi:ABC-type uncharacterized transport system auxiliary subunit
MKQFALLSILTMLAGCFTGGARAPVNWTLDVSGIKMPALAEPRAGSVRISQLTVRTPYDVKQLSVLRPDGSIAFDPWNQFPAAPASMLKHVALDVMSASRAFKNVLPSTSSAKADASVEISVERFALDCRGENSRKAAAAVTVRILRNRELIKTVSGASSVPVEAGRYSDAFSEAFADALLAAISQI